jgi:hypothetical protein
MIATRAADTKTSDAAAITGADMESGRAPHGRLIAAGPTQGEARIGRKGLTPDRNTTQEHRGALPLAVHEIGHVALDLLIGVEVVGLVLSELGPFSLDHVLGAEGGAVALEEHDVVLRHPRPLALLRLEPELGARPGGLAGGGEVEKRRRERQWQLRSIGGNGISPIRMVGPRLGSAQANLGWLDECPLEGPTRPLVSGPWAEIIAPWPG